MRRRLTISLLAAAASAAAAVPIIALAAPGSGLPDLRADAPERPYFQVYNDGRLLLRFDGYVTNVGRGPLDLDGNPQSGTLQQYRLDSGGGWTALGSVPVRYESADGHNHWHWMRAMEYSLRRADTGALVAPSQKVGFCLYDSEPAPGAPFRADQRYDGDGTFCDQGNPSSTSLNMGVSAGWRDLYDDQLTFQWVDVSSTVPGSYALAAVADPDDVIRESDESNPAGTVAVRVPGHVAQGISAGVPGRATALALGATTVTDSTGSYTPGSRRFTITRAPAHGSLDVPVGGTTTGTVTYTPRATYSGPDSFEYVVQDSRGYPRTPPAATATLSVASTVAVSVGVSGAPATLTAGTSVQLSATVANADGGVRWSIDGDVGDGRLGGISASGLYVAPPTPPPAPVTIRATSLAEPSVSGTATITVTPVERPKPAPGRVTGNTSGLLTKPKVVRNGRTVVVRVGARRAGTLAITAMRNGKRVDRCVTRLSRPRGVVCRMRVGRAFVTKPVKIVVVLKARGGGRSSRALVVRP